MKFSTVVTLSIFISARVSAITLEEFLIEVAGTNPAFESESISVRIKQQSTETEKASKEWRISAQALYAYSEPVAVSQFSPTKIENTGVNASVNKQFWLTGGILSLSADLTRTEQDFPLITIPTETGVFTIPAGADKLYDNNISISYTQPLTGNLGGTLYKTPYEISRINLKAEEIQSVENRENILLNAAVKFIDWVLLTESEKILQDKLNIVSEQLETVREKRAANLVDRVDVLRAENAERSARQALIRTEMQLRMIERELTLISSVEISREKPEYELYAFEIIPPESEVTSFDDARAVRALKDAESAAEMQLRAAKKKAVPDLALTAAAGLISGASKFEDSLGFSQEEYSAVLTYAYPVGDSARAAVSAAELTLKKIRKDMEEAENNLSAGLSTIILSLKSLKEVMELNRRIIESARETVKAERELYGLGKSELIFVLQSIENVYSAQLAYAQNAAEYRKTWLRLLELRDRLYKEQGVFEEK